MCNNNNPGGGPGPGGGGSAKKEYMRLSPVNSMGSSAHSSPLQPQDSPPSFNSYK